MFMGVDPSYGSFLVKCLQSGGLYHASDMAVHPHTFSYRGQAVPQALRHHQDRLEGARSDDFNPIRRAEVIQPGTIPTGELQEATMVPENRLSAIKFAPEVTSFEVTSPEVTSTSGLSTSRPQRCANLQQRHWRRLSSTT